MKKNGFQAALLFVLVLMVISVQAVYSAERDQAKEAEHYNRLAEKSPVAAELFRDATRAMDNGEEKVAEEKYRKVLQLVKDFVPALRRLSYVVESNLESIKLSRKALSLEDHPYNKMAVTQSLLRFSDKKPLAEAYTLAFEVAGKLPEDYHAQLLLCQAALVNNQMVIFHSAVVKLKELEPDTISTHYYAGISAAIQEDWEEAEKEILRAKELGLPPDVADRILKETGISSSAQKWRILRYSLYCVAAWAGILVLLLLTGMILSKVTLFSVERQDPEITSEPSGGVRMMRRIYKAVLGMTSIYFYISQPVVILLVLAAGFGVIYGFYSVGRIPIKFVIIIVLIMFGTIGAMLKSLFVRPKKEDPGPRLEEKDAPKLFQVLREVAQKLDTRTVDTVFMVPDTTIAVFERGSIWKRMAGKTERCMIMGLGALKGLTQLQFKSILAHEYGHFYNKDTAGGATALHVRNSIHATAEAMAEGGHARWFNPAWIFINAFYRIFLRISEGASRLQEAMADRLAAQAYGSNAFADGLSNVIRRSVEFNVTTNIELACAEKEDRELRNLYSLEVPKKWPEYFQEEEKSPAEIVKHSFSESMEERTSAYDSHPAPQKRIEWVKRLKNPREERDDGKSAWELMDASLSFQEKMTKQMHENIKQYRIMQAMREAVYEEEY